MRQSLVASLRRVTEEFERFLDAYIRDYERALIVATIGEEKL